MWLRSALFNAAAFAWTFLLLFAFAPALAMPRAAMLACIRLWATSIFRLHRTLLGIDFEFRGLDNLPEGPFVVASAHQSAWDTIGFYACFADPAYVLKSELYRIPMFGPYARKLGQITVDRSGNPLAARQMLRGISAALEEGRQVIIFPGGTRSPAGRDTPIRSGIAAVYRHGGVPIVPASLNSGVFWARRSFVKRPGKIVVRFGVPIAPGLERGEFLGLLAERINAGNRALLDEVPAEQRPGH